MKSVSQLTALGEVGQAIARRWTWTCAENHRVARRAAHRARRRRDLRYDEPAEQFHLRARELARRFSRFYVARRFGEATAQLAQRSPRTDSSPRDTGRRLQEQVPGPDHPNQARALLAVPLMHEEPRRRARRASEHPDRFPRR